MKSVPVAAALGLALGPLGLLYVGAAHAAMSLGVGAALALASGGALLAPFWVACGLWGGLAASGRRSARPDGAAPLYRPALGPRSPLAVRLPPLGSASDSSGKFCLACGAYLAVSTRSCGRCGASAA